MTDIKHSAAEIRRNVKYGQKTIPLILQLPPDAYNASCKNALKEEILAILGQDLSQFLLSEESDLTPPPRKNPGKAVP